jgi:hypothetical protein
MIVKVHLAQCVNSTPAQTIRITMQGQQLENIPPLAEAAGAYLVPGLPRLAEAPPGGIEQIIRTRHPTADQVEGLFAGPLKNGGLNYFLRLDNAAKVNREDPTGFYLGLLWSGVANGSEGISVHLVYTAFSSSTGFDSIQAAFLGYANVFDPRADGNPLFEDRLEVKIGVTVFPDNVSFKVWSENETEAQIIEVIRKIEADIDTMHSFAEKVLEFIE